MSQVSAAERMDSDVLDAILVRLVRIGPAGQGPRASPSDSAAVGDVLSGDCFRSQVDAAATLCRCACVCRAWSSASLNDSLWRVLLVRRCDSVLPPLQQPVNVMPLSFRRMLVRSMTTQILLWGLCAKNEEDGVRQLSVADRPPGCTAPRTPTLLTSDSSDSHDRAWTSDSLRLAGVRLVSAGFGFSCAVTWEGGVLCWGNNTEGQCGTKNSSSYIAHPVKIQLPQTVPSTRVSQVSCGMMHTACVTFSGLVLCWGSNAMGQLGVGKGAGSLSSQELVTAEVPQCAMVCEVACGAVHTLALAVDGRVFSWGSNRHGQCGPEEPHGNDVMEMGIRPLPADVDVSMIAVHSHGHLEGRGRTVRVLSSDGEWEEQQRGTVWRVAAGADFSLLAMSHGVMSFGSNTHGQLGRATEDGKQSGSLLGAAAVCDATPGLVSLPVPPPRSDGASGGSVVVEDVCCGDEHCLVLLSDARVYVWGRGTQAALGLGAGVKNAPKPVQLPSSGDLRGVLRPSTNDAGCRLSLAAGGASSALLSSGGGFPHESGARSNSGASLTTPPRPTTSDQSTRKEGAVEGTEVADNFGLSPEWKEEDAVLGGQVDREGGVKGETGMIGAVGSSPSMGNPSLSQAALRDLARAESEKLLREREQEVARDEDQEGGRVKKEKRVKKGVVRKGDCRGTFSSFRNKDLRITPEKKEKNERGRVDRKKQGGNVDPSPQKEAAGAGSGAGVGLGGDRAGQREISQLYTWGANKCGELGHGDTQKRTVPRVVKMLKGSAEGRGWASNVFAVSLGSSHAVALAEWRVPPPPRYAQA